jgi:prepilin-type N-terminal cleavage/methylation domain-containing protein|tara:strand:- start:1143 stop:1877 length:735 start_codon:yes stop_codon:yes gene_type:complete
MQAQEKKVKGFSLLELLVVIAIIGIMSGLGYPGISKWIKERQFRQDVERIQAIIKNTHIQTERGTFAYVQVIFDNTGANLVVTSKGMKMDTLATKINDGDNEWNTTPNTRCRTGGDDYWDTDIVQNDADTTNDDLANLVYSITLEYVTTTFDDSSAVCFSRGGKYYEASSSLSMDETTGKPYNYIFVCRKSDDVDLCPADYGSGSSLDEEVGPTSTIKYLNVIQWSRYGNFSLIKWSGTEWFQS